MSLARETTSSRDAALMDLAVAGDLAALGSLYDAYGAELYRLAQVVVGHSAGAQLAVCEGFRHARARPVDGVAPQDPARELVRLTLLASRAIAEDERLGASLLGLTIFGNHTYREAALLLGMAPDEAADVLRTALLDARHPSVRPAVTTNRSPRSTLGGEPGPGGI